MAIWICMRVSAETRSVRSISKQLLHTGDSELKIHHWQGREITLQADPPQDVWIDGEIGGETPFNTSVIPKALEIVVPE